MFPDGGLIPDGSDVLARPNLANRSNHRKLSLHYFLKLPVRIPTLEGFRQDGDQIMKLHKPPMFATINPTTGETLKSFPPITDQEVEQRIKRSSDAFSIYRTTSFTERSSWMLRAAGILETEKHELGRLMTTEMGKTLVSAVQEAEKCAWACRYFAGNAEILLADEVVQTNATRSFVRHQPLGPIVAIMPWNFPFWQVFRFAAPAVMAGNVVLLKHSPNVPQCALRIEEIFRQSGFPAGVFQTLLIGTGQTGRLLENRCIRAATLTGSVRAGTSVAGMAGKHIRKTVLELGGSDPFIVMPGVDVGEAAKIAVTARCVNNGESCIAAKRFIVHEKIYDEFERQFVAGMGSLTVGDPMDRKTDIGPLARIDLLEHLDEQVKKSVAMGARVLIGGKKLDRAGYFYAPTVLADIPEKSPAYVEELFGPVAALFRIRSIDEAIGLANDTEFGLGSAAWTNDDREKEKFIHELDSGLVFINGMVASDPRLPFGGVKSSGYGRELGACGIREFVNIKTVWIKE